MTAGKAASSAVAGGGAYARLGDVMAVRRDDSIRIESRSVAELAALHASPVFWGRGVPRGDGRLVIVVPGLFGNDLYLRPLYNEWLDTADISFDPAACDNPVNVRARQLRRQFTLGRFDRGGRLFGGFWVNLPKPVRLIGIRIDGEAVAGLDYSALNPRLAYHIAAADPPPGDAYTLAGLEQSRDRIYRRARARDAEELLGR